MEGTYFFDSTVCARDGNTEANAGFNKYFDTTFGIKKKRTTSVPKIIGEINNPIGASCTSLSNFGTFFFL